MVLLFDGVECWTPKYGPSRLQNAEGTFDYVSCLCMFEVEVLFIILRCSATVALFLEMVSNTSVRC